MRHICGIVIATHKATFKEIAAFIAFWPIKLIKI